LTDAGVEAIARVEFAVEVSESGLGFVEVADIVFGGIFRAAFVEELEQSLFERVDVDPFAYDVVVGKVVPR
jgi:hypothetical protein